MQTLVVMVRLRAAGLSKGYRQSLREAGRWLLSLVEELGVALKPTDEPHRIDYWLERAIELAYKQGEKYYLENLGLVSTQRTFHLSAPLLRGAWSAMRGWRSLKPTKSRIPLTRFRLECMVVAAFARARAEVGWLRRRWLACAIGCWLGFVCLLRPSELLNLRCCDVSLPEGNGGDAEELGAVLVIRKPKTRRIWREQFVTCKDASLVRWLAWWMAEAKPDAPLLGLSRYLLARHFSRTLVLLGLEDVHYTLGSLRAGGCTDHFQRHRNLGELQFLGRWQQASTLQFYLHEAYAVHVTRQSSSTSKALLFATHAHVHLLKNPPSRSLRTLVRDF